MSWIIGFLTAILVLNCVLLILLVLIQLPKKEAGLGTAFGGSTTDALFGAGTGNVLTKMTKYTAGIFLVLTCTLYMLNSQQSRARSSRFEKILGETSPPSLSAPAPDTNVPVSALPAPIPTNLPTPPPQESAPPVPTENASPPAQPETPAPSAPDNAAAPAPTESGGAPAPKPPEQPN